MSFRRLQSNRTGKKKRDPKGTEAVSDIEGNSGHLLPAEKRLRAIKNEQSKILTRFPACPMVDPIANRINKSIQSCSFHDEIYHGSSQVT